MSSELEAFKNKINFLEGCIDGLKELVRDLTSSVERLDADHRAHCDWHMQREPRLEPYQAGQPAPIDMHTMIGPGIVEARHAQPADQPACCVTGGKTHGSTLIVADKPLQDPDAVFGKGIGVYPKDQPAGDDAAARAIAMLEMPDGDGMVINHTAARAWVAARHLLSAIRRGEVPGIVAVAQLVPCSLSPTPQVVTEDFHNAVVTKMNQREADLRAKLATEVFENKRLLAVQDGIREQRDKAMADLAAMTERAENLRSEYDKLNAKDIQHMEETDAARADADALRSELMEERNHREKGESIMRELTKQRDALKARKVTLPEARMLRIDSSQARYSEAIGYNQALNQCADAIRAAGISVEGE